MGLVKSNWRNLVVFLACFASAAHATNLMEVYHDALCNDPTYKQAESTWMSARQALPIAQSGYLPSFTVQGTAFRSLQVQRPSNVQQFIGNGWFNTYATTLTLNQPIFNAPAWFAIRKADAAVKSAGGTYLAAAQDLMVRTARAYFEVLQAYDTLRYTIANKEAVYRQLLTAREKFKVGLIAVTGVYEARSSYDQAVADEINNRNELNNKLENLRAITGERYCVVAGVGIKLPLVSPQPNNLNEWVCLAQQQNFALQAQNFAVISARENIRQQGAANWPVLTAQGNYSDTLQSDLPRDVRQQLTFREFEMKNKNLGVVLNWPVLQGGLVTATTKQARYDYITQAGKLEFVYRDTLNRTRQAFLGVMSGISQVRADEQAILSARNSLEATQAGYEVGTRTMVDVLNALTTLYRSQQQHAIDEYNYLMNTVLLKQAAGTLSYTDLELINCWLSKRIEVDRAAQFRDVRTSEVDELELAKRTAPDLDNLSPPTDNVRPSTITPSSSITPSSGTLESGPSSGSVTSGAGPTSTSPTATTPSSSAAGTSTINQNPPVYNPVYTPNRSLNTTPSSTQFPERVNQIPQKSSELKSKNKHSYAIQLYSSKDRKQVELFQKKHGKNFSLEIIKTHNGLYHVIHKHYSSFSAAEQALKGLNSEMKKTHPWVIPLS